jgi:hypothetical protein
VSPLHLSPGIKGTSGLSAQMGVCVTYGTYQLRREQRGANCANCLPVRIDAFQGIPP